MFKIIKKLKNFFLDKKLIFFLFLFFSFLKINYILAIDKIYLDLANVKFEHKINFQKYQTTTQLLTKTNLEKEIHNWVKKNIVLKGKSGELTIKNDPRVLPFGHFLRKTSIDELPQLINVLKGEMSFVGPRPLRVRYLPYYTKREDLRHTVKPGITGLAQVSGRNAITWDNRLELDAVYVEKQSFLYDFKILLKTVLKVFDFSATEFSGESDSLDEHRISGSIK